MTEATEREEGMYLSTRRLAITTLGLLTLLASLVAGAAPAAAQAATISGTVLATDTGQPPGGCVYAYRSSDGSLAAGTCMDLQTGAYSIEGLEVGVAYRIQVSSGAPYPQETWWPGGPTINDAQPVVAPATVDVGLPPAGTLVGTLKRSDGSPVADEFVTVFLANREEPFGRYTTTGADGSWSIGDLYPTAYKVAFGGFYQAFAFGKSDWASADTVAVAAGATVRVDDTLFLPASISGTVRDQSGGPVEGICVSLENLDPNSGGGWTGGCTDASGDHRAGDITPAGDYRVLFSDPQGRFAAEYYDDTTDPASATVVTVARGAQVAGIDAVLAPGAALTGRVIDARTHRPIEGVCMEAFAGRAGGRIPFQQQECSQADGTWRLWALPAGATTVHFFYFDAQVEIWAYNPTTQAKATVFELTAGTTTTLRDVRLRLPRAG
ncbi:MAG TPA: carboxypeptidase-like regulatory domain-containing protein [Actinomycetota bacterium]|nr:carboxypeptidase-like regulatory domain-containing protein [Actinomycetota bacterium]